MTTLASPMSTGVLGMVYTLSCPCSALSLSYRVHKLHAARKAPTDLPRSLPPAGDSELRSGIYEHPAFGRLHIVLPSSASEGMPKTIISALLEISKARFYGSTFSGGPDLIAIFEKKQVELTYYALYRRSVGLYAVEDRLIHRTVNEENAELIDTNRTVRH